MKHENKISLFIESLDDYNLILKIYQETKDKKALRLLEDYEQRRAI